MYPQALGLVRTRCDIISMNRRSDESNARILLWLERSARIGPCQFLGVEKIDTLDKLLYRLPNIATQAPMLGR